MKVTATDIATGAVNTVQDKQAADGTAFKAALEKADLKLRTGEKTAPFTIYEIGDGPAEVYAVE